MQEKPTPQEAWSDLGHVFRSVYEPPLLAAIWWIDRQLRRVPWLYRKLGGTP